MQKNTWRKRIVIATKDEAQENRAFTILTNFGPENKHDNISVMKDQSIMS